ncbi:hypothetical protein HOC80_04430 [archaeon]|jgi:hypothetical protein|nr:hypothetical protein [archaeon]MBT4417320.1 hypothetical protein [archaeon]
MSSSGPSSAVSALLVIVVIFVVVITVLMIWPESKEKLIGIADDTFQIGQETFQSQDMAKNTTLTTYNEFSSDMVECFNYAKENCFCNFNKETDLAGGHSIIFLNQGGNLGLMSMTENQEVLASEEYNSKSIGLFVVKKSGSQRNFGCIYPGQVEIFDDGDNWYVEYEGDEYYFYRDLSSNEEHVDELGSAPLLYNVDGNNYCILTTLIEENQKDIDPEVIINGLGTKTFGGTDFTQIYSFFETSQRDFCHG